MGGVDFLNIEYFLLLVYRIYTGTNVDISQIPSQTLQLMEYIAWAGLGLSLFLLFAFVWLHKKAHAVSHAGWHERDEQIEELKRKHTVHAAKNPAWEHVVALAGSPLENDWRRAIIEADSMLDALLTTRGYGGATLGDKLKTANPLQFTTLDLAWKAHKVRNDIAHGGEQFHLTDRDAKSTIDFYRRVFEEFDYL
ncbi:MAG: hypothetical protein Q7R71_01510 [bacterium]|nr:hypothetical protein [bacterium]